MNDFEEISLHQGLERLALDVSNLRHLLRVAYSNFDDSDCLDALFVIAMERTEALESLAAACLSDSSKSRRAAA
jgi:hypothetical protein